MPDSREKKTGLKSIGRAVSKRAKSAKDSAGQAIEITRDAAVRSGEVVDNITADTRRLVRKGIYSARRTTRWESVPSSEVLDTLSSSITTSRALRAGAKSKLTAQIGPALESLSVKGTSAQAQTLSTVQGLLANAELSRSVNAWLQGMVSGSPTIYDRAMDATYNTTHIGGHLHRMFDGSHTIPGAFEAVRNASPDDNIFQEAAGLLQALARDALESIRK